VTRTDVGLRVAAGTVSAHEINRALVHAGIGVEELRHDRASLEEIFVELTVDAEAAA
jgi:hypothetical protein